MLEDIEVFESVLDGAWNSLANGGRVLLVGDHLDSLSRSWARDREVEIVNSLEARPTLLLCFPFLSRAEQKEIVRAKNDGAEILELALPEDEVSRLTEQRKWLLGLNPENDGLDHINVYSRARSELGRRLSNWSQADGGRMIETQDGPFQTVEGYWFWLGIDNGLGSAREELRRMDGARAKRVGPELRTQAPAGDVQSPSSREFREKIFHALISKTELSPQIQKLLSSSKLPFCHYYVFGTPGKVVRGDAQWVISLWDQIRNSLSE